jgi:hypothetical protein
VTLGAPSFRFGEEMSTNPMLTGESNRRRYDAVLRISEALCACCEPEELAKTLADEIGNFTSTTFTWLC